MIKRIFILIFLIFNVFTFVNAQQSIKNSPITKADTLSNINIGSTENSASFTQSSSTITYKPGKNTDIDSVVVYKAKDSVKFNLRKKEMYLRGESELDYKVQHLSAEIQVIDFNTSVLTAHGVKDSNNKIIGFPKFTDKGESYVGEQIIYNFKTSQGTISLGETQVSEGYYFGSKIKRISGSELFVQDGCYTTCDAPHPHFYFGSPEMKVIASDRIFLDPLIFYVEDLPIFMLPFGLFFPNKSGRQSGIMIPSFFFSNNRGVVIQDLGVYFALSDYYDTQFNLDFFSKGGYTLKNSTRWKLLDVFDGNMNLEYGKTRYDPDDDYTKNYKIALRHNHTIDPQSRIVANLSFMSQDFNVNTDFKNYNNRLTQNVTSNASYSKSFDNGSSMSVAYNREQNIRTEEWRENTARLNYSFPQLQPLKSLVPAGTWLPDWMRDLSFSYSGSGNYYQENVMQSDSNYKWNYRSSITHNPSVSISPKLGYFNINPYFSFGANNYFRRLTKTYNPEDSTVSESFEDGFFTEYNYSTGVDVSTRLFGIITPKLLGVNAVRHTFQPSVGYAFSPDLSTPDYNFYGRYFNIADSNEVKYSRFSADGGGIASSRESQSLRYSILNSFEAKIAQGDTIPDKNVEFFRWTINSSYDMTDTAFNFRDVSMQLRIPALSDINMSASANFTVYDEAKKWDEKTQDYTGSRTRINETLYENGKGLMRLTNFNMQFSTSFSSKGMNVNPSFGQDAQPVAPKDSASSPGLGDRFKQRYDFEEEYVDLYGDNSPGYSPIVIPWNLTLGLTFQYSEPYRHQIERRINLTSSFSFNLTNTWSIRGNAQYDFKNMELLAPSFEINKDMHCWQLSFQWWPIGYNAGFYLRFAIKAPQLQDLKIEKKDNPLLR
ncbi:MAG: putative LPS assembly protein LptD [bacterium]